MLTRECGGRIYNSIRDNVEKVTTRMRNLINTIKRDLMKGDHTNVLQYAHEFSQERKIVKGIEEGATFFLKDCNARIRNGEQQQDNMEPNRRTVQILESNLTALETEIRTLNDKLSSSNEDDDGIKKMIRDAESRRNSINEQLNEQRKNYENNIQNVEEELTGATEQEATLKTDIKVLNGQLQEATHNLVDLHTLKSTAEHVTRNDTKRYKFIQDNVSKIEELHGKYVGAKEGSKLRKDYKHLYKNIKIIYEHVKLGKKTVKEAEEAFNNIVTACTSVSYSPEVVAMWLSIRGITRNSQGL
ncbi:MAG TPA: hypothetical protein VGL94_03710 [Ktedonobacteraceae bacterium]